MADTPPPGFLGDPAVVAAAGVALPVTRPPDFAIEYTHGMGRSGFSRIRCDAAGCAYVRRGTVDWECSGGVTPAQLDAVYATARARRVDQMQTESTLSSMSDGDTFQVMVLAEGRTVRVDVGSGQRLVVGTYADLRAVGDAVEALAWELGLVRPENAPARCRR